MGHITKLKNNLILCTDSFSEEEVLRLIDILRNKFNLSCGIIKYNKNNNSYRIRINKSSMENLISIVKPYTNPSMFYKLGFKSI